MYKLYGRRGTGSDAPQIILELAGIGYDFVDVSERTQRSADFKRLNPVRQLPVLMLSSGVLLTESAAICLYIAESNPDSHLLPEVATEERAAVYRWLFFAGTALYEDYRRHYHADRYIDAENVDALKLGALELLDSHWKLVDNALGEKQWIAGEHYSVADIYLAMLSDWSLDRQAMWDQCPSVARMCKAIGSTAAASKIGVAQSVVLKSVGQGSTD